MENKKSLKYLFVAACLALLIVSIGGVVSASATAVATNDDLKIAGASLDLSDKISIAFAVEASAIGYDAENNTATTNVYIYTENPTGKSTAAGEAKIETLKPMTVGGKDYVMFISEGFAPVAYGQTIYVRLVAGEGKEFGKVYKTSVIELVKNLQAKLDESDARYEAKSGLYNAILTYGQTAQKVLGSKYPVYNYFTVEDGGYVDNAGQVWTSGVVEKGTEINLTANADFGDAVVWTDGTTEFKGNTTAVSTNGAVYSVSYYDMSLVNKNVWTTGWNGMTVDSYAESQIAQLLADTGVNKVSSAGASNISTRTFSLNANNKGVYYISQPNKYYNGSETKIETTSPGAGDQYFRLSTIGAEANQPMSLNFTIRFPGSDVNENGILWDYGPHSYTESVKTGVDEESGEDVYETKTLYQNGDMFKGGKNNNMMRFTIVASTGVTAKESEILMYVGFDAVTGTQDGVKVVTGWRLALSSGTDIQSGKETTNGDSNKYYDTKVYSLDDPHDVSVQLVPAEDGTVDEIKIFVDGEYRASHYASNGSGKGGFTKNDQVLFGSSKTSSYIGFNNVVIGRFCGDYEVSNVNLLMHNHVTVEELVARGYGTEVSKYTEGAIVAGYDVANKATVHYAWDELTDGEKHVLLVHNNVNKSYWTYDAATDSVVVRKIDTSTDAGAVNFLLANPLYGMSTDTWNGESVVFEFTMKMGSGDRNADGLYDTDNDNRSATGSTVWGQLNIGYGDGQYDYSRAYVSNAAANRTINGISANNSLLGNFRIMKSNNSSNLTSRLNNWSLGYYYQSSDGFDYYSAGYNGAELVIRIVVTPDENGVPATLKYYANNVLVTTRKNEVNDKGGFTFCSDTNGALTSLFNAEYLEISQFMRKDAYATTVFSNFASWMQK